MGLPIEMKPTAYIVGQKVRDSQLFKENLKQNIESQHQCTFAFVHGLRICSPEMAICKWFEMDVQMSVIKNVKKHIYKDPRIS